MLESRYEGARKEIRKFLEWCQRQKPAAKSSGFWDPFWPTFREYWTGPRADVFNKLELLLTQLKEHSENLGVQPAKGIYAAPGDSPAVRLSQEAVTVLPEANVEGAVSEQPAAPISPDDLHLDQDESHAEASRQSKLGVRQRKSPEVGDLEKGLGGRFEGPAAELQIGEAAGASSAVSSSLTEHEK